MAMQEERYKKIFMELEQAPIEEFLKIIMRNVPAEDRKRLVLEDVSFHRYNADIVSLEAWMCLAPVESNQWIWVRVEMDAATGSIQEEFYTTESYRKETLPSLQACIDYYKKVG